MKQGGKHSNNNQPGEPNSEYKTERSKYCALPTPPARQRIVLEALYRA